MSLQLVALLTLISILNAPNGSCSKILFVSSTPASYSHQILSTILVKELCRKGHHVTMLSAIQTKEQFANFREIVIPQKLKDDRSLFVQNTMSTLMRKEFNLIYGLIGTENTVQSVEFQRFLHENSTFDAIVVSYFENRALIGIVSHYFKSTPIILLGATGFTTIHNDIFRSPMPSSYVPLVTSKFSQKMSFLERTCNFLLNIYTHLRRELVYMPLQREIFHRFVDKSTTLEDILLSPEIAFMLTYSNPIVDGAIPKLPNIKEVGGYHVKEKSDFIVLDSDLKKFLDEASDGVILFSMGSMMQMKEFDSEMVSSLVESFAKLKQRVVWKYEGKVANISDNMRILKWLPQQELLSHPNMRLFICHGGLQSVFEAAYYGIPVIGIPIFGNHFIVMRNAIDRGYAIELPLLTDLKSDKLTFAINEILNNPSYKENALYYSELLRDVAVKPLDRAIYWIEYVTRHKGVPHLRSVGIDMKWYQRDLIDVWAGLLAIAFVICGSIYVAFKRIFKGVNIKKKID